MCEGLNRKGAYLKFWLRGEGLIREGGLIEGGLIELLRYVCVCMLEIFNTVDTRLRECLFTAWSTN